MSGALTYKRRGYIPPDSSLHYHVICRFHYNPGSDNFGAFRTTEHVSGDFYWQVLDATIRKVIVAGEICHGFKDPRYACQRVIMTLPLPFHPLERITMHFFTDFQESIYSGFTSRVLIIDQMPMRLVNVLCQQDIHSAEIASMYFKCVIC
jgi:hypothetical protein